MSEREIGEGFDRTSSVWGGVEISRRCFMCGVTTGMLGNSLLTKAAAQQPAKVRAINDPNVVHSKVEFPSGSDIIDGYLARPKKKGRYPVVLVIPGNWIVEPYIQETAAMLAQGEFIGLAINVFHFFPKVETYEDTEKIPWQTTQQLVRDHYRDERINQDVQAAIDYLRSQSFVRKNSVGIIGFCGGGASALLSAAGVKDIGAVVPFYAPVTLKFPERKTPMEVAGNIRVPVQGHYGTKDKGISLNDVKKFEQTLRSQGPRIEIYTYEAGHGFFAYNRDESYDPEAAKLAWTRTRTFLKRHLR